VNYKEITRNTYNEKAEQISARFAICFSLYTQQIADKFLDLCSCVSADFRLLDVGCGSGDAAAYLQKAVEAVGGSVVGIDISSEMLKLASDKEVDVIQMDIENLAFSDGSFDAIWAMSSLLHLPKRCLPAVLERIANLLKDDGVLYISVKKGYRERFITTAELEKRYYSFWQKKEFLSLLTEHFQLVDFSETARDSNLFLNFYLRK